MNGTAIFDLTNYVIEWMGPNFDVFLGKFLTMRNITLYSVFHIMLFLFFIDNLSINQCYSNFKQNTEAQYVCT